jgi:hypothetical protein
VNKWFLWLIGVVAGLTQAGSGTMFVLSKRTSTEPTATNEADQVISEEEALTETDDDLDAAERLEADIETSIEDSVDEDLSDIYEATKDLE